MAFSLHDDFFSKIQLTQRSNFVFLSLLLPPIDLALHSPFEARWVLKMPVAVGAASVFTTRKVAAYGLLSTLAAFAVVLSAFRQRSNFYSAAVMLGRSNGCMMVGCVYVFSFFHFAILLNFLALSGALQLWSLSVPVLWQGVPKSLLRSPSRCGSRGK